VNTVCMFFCVRTENAVSFPRWREGGATARSKEQGADGGQGAAAERTIQAARMTRYIEFHSNAR